MNAAKKYGKTRDELMDRVIDLPPSALEQLMVDLERGRTIDLHEGREILPRLALLGLLACLKDYGGKSAPEAIAPTDLVMALEGLVAFIDDLEATHCGLDDFTGNYPALPDALAFARAAIEKARPK